MSIAICVKRRTPRLPHPPERGSW